MIITDIIKLATKQFEQKMFEFGKKLNTQQLTAELADQVSMALQKSLSGAGAIAYKAFLESYDPEGSVIDANGQKLRFKMVSPKTFLSPFGKITVHRRLYQADTGGVGCVPLDHLWDMDGHFATVQVREAICLSMAHMTAEETEQLFKKCTLFQPSATAIKHIVEKVGEEISHHEEQIVQQISTKQSVPDGTRVLVASMDGANVLLREPGSRRRRPVERPSKQDGADKQSSYKNAMVGSFSFYGDTHQNQDCPERLGSYYTARMPEDRAVRFKGDFERQLEFIQAKVTDKVPKILLFDGARGLWKYAENTDRFNDYEKLIDFYHTSEHLSKAGEALFGKGNDRAQAWYDKYWAKLLEDDDGAESVLRSMGYYSRSERLGKSRRKALEAERRFFRRNKHRMCYASFRRRGFPIGSGPVEAACKSIVKTRLCRSGMRWSRLGGQHILDLRCYAKSGLWNEFWETYKYVRKSA
jgi:hypothetical protein